MQRRKFLLSSGIRFALPSFLGLPTAALATPIKSRAETVVKAPLEVVWDLMVKIDQWPGWNPAVYSAKLDGPLVTGSTFRWKAGDIAIISTLRDIEAPRRLTWSGVAFGTQAVHSWQFDIVEQGTRVMTFETLEGWLPSIVPGMQASLDNTLSSWLAHLKAAAEGDSGRPASPQGPG